MRAVKIEWKTCLRAGVSIFILYLCIYYWKSAAGFLSSLAGAAAPLVTGGAAAYAVNILMAFYERHYFPSSRKKLVLRTRRPVCMFAAFISLAAAVVLVSSLIGPQLVSCVQFIIAQLPGFMTEAVQTIDRLDLLPESIVDTLSKVDWQSRIGQIIQVVTSGIGSVMDVLVSTLSSVFSWIVAFMLSLIFAVYLLLGKETLARQCRSVGRRYLPSSWCTKLLYLFRTLDDCFHKFIVGQCTEAVILGILCTAGMFILRLPYAAMIGALIAFTALIPVAGAYIGAGVGAFMILTVSPVKALIFLVFLVLLQQFEGNIIYPKVVGTSIGLPGIWVLLAVTVGGGMFGIPGMLIGVPLAATVYRLVREDVRHVSPLAPSRSAAEKGVKQS